MLDIRKCPNPIWPSVGHPISSWTIFGQVISNINFTPFLTLWVFGAQFGERYYNVRFSLDINGSQIISMWDAENNL